MLQCMFAGGWFFQRGGWLQEPGDLAQVGRAKPQVKHQIHVVPWVCKRELYHILLIWNSMCILTSMMSMQHALITITYIPVLSTNNNEYQWIWIKYIYILYTDSIDDFLCLHGHSAIHDVLFFTVSSLVSPVHEPRWSGAGRITHFASPENSLLHWDQPKPTANQIWTKVSTVMAIFCL